MKRYFVYILNNLKNDYIKKKNRPVLYNIIFPLWMLWIFPVTWIVVLPANFLIDLLVLLLTMRCLKLSERKEIARHSILKVWISGFVADFAGTAVMFSAILLDSFLDYQSPLGIWWYENMTNAVALNPFTTLPAFLWSAVCIVLSGFCIYLLNYRLALKKDVPDETVRKKLALSLAVFTAPYLFLLPAAWFY